jgi:hypothetical protein
VLIATEDEASARRYLQKIANEIEVRERCAVTFADHAGSNPRSVFQGAKAFDEEWGEFDEIWLVFDTEGPQTASRDADARNALESVRQMNLDGRNRYRTAVSNPCFEYWLILHFERNATPFADCGAACKRLRKHIRGYDKSTDSYPKTRQMLDTARRNAAELFRERCGSGHPCDCHPCTQMFRLIESLFT